MVDENALGFDSKSIPLPVVCMSPKKIFLISFSDDWSYRKNGDSLFGFALPQNLNSGYSFVGDESSVDDRDLNIVLHVAMVSPYSFPQGPRKAKRR